MKHSRLSEVVLSFITLALVVALVVILVVS